jgi:hypothetical protein
MKNTKRCPKCQSDEIILIPGKSEASGADKLIARRGRENLQWGWIGMFEQGSASNACTVLDI